MYRPLAKAAVSKATRAALAAASACPTLRGSTFRAAEADFTVVEAEAAATTPEERVLVADLGSIAARVAAERVRAPALIVVGEIVALRAELLALVEAPA